VEAHGSGRRDGNGEDVETIRARRAVVLAVFPCGTFDPEALRAGDGVLGMRVPPAGLDLDEDQATMIVGDDIDLAAPGNVRAGE
jgi:hypothetical protein